MMIFQEWLVGFTGNKTQNFRNFFRRVHAAVAVFIIYVNIFAYSQCLYIRRYSYGICLIVKMEINFRAKIRLPKEIFSRFSRYVCFSIETIFSATDYLIVDNKS